ncbi:MAG: dihydroorotase [Candidatus Omnitrophica bacterium]|nr:dihydroorotase [Candidatus Omnitrophota bacterium]
MKPLSNILIKGSHLIDPASERDGKFDVLIEKGTIKKIAPAIEPQNGIEVLDAGSFHLFPGFIDLHVHFREPGFEQKETILTGCQAALRGGFVACVTMPNTQPPCDNQSVVEHILSKSREVPFRLFPAGTLTRNREGKELSEMADLKRAGAIAVTDDGNWVEDSLLMRRCMEYASMNNLVVITHAEDHRLSADGVMNEGIFSTSYGLKGSPVESEIIAVSRDIELVRLTKADLHVAHISTAGAIELVRRAQKDGLPVTAEVTPHHFSLTDELLETYNTNLKMNPPLRSRADVEAIKKGLKDGTIGMIATDHAPHTEEDKMAEINYAPVGTIGLETAAGVALTELYHKKVLTLAQLAEKFSINPAKRFNLKGYGVIREGALANLTLVDLEEKWTVTKDCLVSKSRNSCFLGAELRGRVKAAFCLGRFWNYA